MNVTPQQSPTTPGYPSHHGLTPLQTAALTALACVVTSCDQTQQRTGGQIPVLPESGYKESQPVDQKKKVIRQNKPRQTSPPVSTATEKNVVITVPPEEIYITDGISKPGEMVAEPTRIFNGGPAALPTSPESADRERIIEIDDNTPASEP